jgi:hypothetical protein
MRASRSEERSWLPAMSGMSVRSFVDTNVLLYAHEGAYQS